MHRILFALAAAATLALGAAAAESDDAPSIDRLGTLALIEQDFLREDSRVFRNREGGETVEASVTVNAVRYKLGLQRPQHFEHMLVIESRDGVRCPGLQTIIVGTRTGRIYQGICQASIALRAETEPAYYEAELDRLLAIFRPLLAPHAPSRRDGS